MEDLPLDRTAALVPEFAGKDLSLGRTLDDVICICIEIFMEVHGLKQGPCSLVRTIGQLLDKRRREVWLRKLKLRLRDRCFGNHCHLAGTDSVGLGSLEL